MTLEGIKNKSKSTERLYHYTPFDSAIKILQGRTLLFGRLKDMNDINELYRPMVPNFNPDLPRENFERLYNNLKKEIGKYQQISLTVDDFQKGFNIPAMWGHYADKGNGVCLVFDKNKFIKSLGNGQKRHILFDGVSYTDEFSSTVFCQAKTDGSIVTLNDEEEKEYFFRKTKDWRYEQEFRVLVKTDSESREKLDFQDSLLAIVMHNAKSVALDQTVFDSIEFKIIEKIISSYNPVVPVLEHCVFFKETMLKTEEHTIWSSNPQNYDGYTHKAIEMADRELSKI